MPDNYTTSNNGGTQQSETSVLDGLLVIDDNLSDVRPYDIPLGPETRRNLQEKTRTRLAMWLAKIFGASIAASFLLGGIATLNPQTVDPESVEGLITLLVTPQVGILGVALGFYFRDEEK